MKARTLFVLLALIIGASPAFAQTTQSAIPDRVNAYVLPSSSPDTGQPLGSPRVTPIAAASPNCNQAPTPDPAPGLVLVNPRTAEVSDPFNPGKVCVVDVPTGLPLSPTGVTYKLVTTYVAPSCLDATGQTTLSPCEGAKKGGAPFFEVRPILVAPAAPARVVVRPPS
jgi:hypothetical protein